MLKTHNPACARVAVLVAKNRFEAEQQLLLVSGIADVIELRLDYWSNPCLTEIAQLRNKLTLPVIFTLRKPSQGGHCHWPEEQRLAFIKKLAELAPEYLDLEYDTPYPWLQNFRREFSNIIIIGSYHDFTRTPENFMESAPALFKPEFDIIKLAYMAADIIDTLRLLIFINSLSRQHNVIGIAMGEAGHISRILAPVLGSVMTYGTINENLNSAPGQISLQDLTEIYRLPQLNRHTQIYALLGDPITQSPGHIVHNNAFQNLGKNAVYVKCQVKAHQLSQCLSLMKELPFYGMSVTIPHKETIVPFINKLADIAEEIKIVNTVKREDQQYYGYNTDAHAAVEVLEKTKYPGLTPGVFSLFDFAPREASSRGRPRGRIRILPLGKPPSRKVTGLRPQFEDIKLLSNESVLILGAGGSAKAIGYALQRAGANITLCNRTLSRAQLFTAQYGGAAIDFKTLFSQKFFPYSIVINTLPAAAYVQQCADWRLPQSDSGMAMDIVLNPLETTFLKYARQSGWLCLSGDIFYHAQASRQLKIWFDSSSTSLN